MTHHVPIPNTDVTVRVATMGDVAFVDGLQKLHREGLGFMATSWIEGKIANGEIIIAEDVTGHLSLDTRGGLPDREGPSSDKYQVTNDTRVGYCMGVDRHFKRDDVGIIHQMNVVPGQQRSFVAAALLKAVGIEDAGKFDVSRALPDVTTPMMTERPTLLLPAA